MSNNREGNYCQANFLTDKTVVAARWRKHLEPLLNRENVSASTNRLSISGDGQAVGTLNEVKKAIKELKNSGKDELPAEVFKYAREKLHEILHHSLLKIWEVEELLVYHLAGWKISFVFFTKRH